jgi:translation initiation factor IF-3
LIDDLNENRGITAFTVAIRLAEEKALDLVEIAQKDGFPLCKIIDYGKMKYDLQKKKKPTAKVVTKEVKMSPRIDQHDVGIKLKQVENWINEGFKVYVAVQFRGRENTHKDLGLPILEQFKLPGAVWTDLKSEGNTMHIWVSKAPEK